MPKSFGITKLATAQFSSEFLHRSLVFNFQLTGLYGYLHVHTTYFLAHSQKLDEAYGQNSYQFAILKVELTQSATWLIVQPHKSVLRRSRSVDFNYIKI